MTRQRHAIARFEEHSLALFAALVMSASAAAHAQNSGAGPGGAMVQTQATMGPGTPPTATNRSSIDAVFARADTDKDGRLSREESIRLPAVHERFDEIDTDKDRYLSRAEFDKGVSN